MIKNILIRRLTLYFLMVMAVFCSSQLVYSQEETFFDRGTFVIRKDLGLNDSVYNNYVTRDLAYGGKVQHSSVEIFVDYQVSYNFRDEDELLEVSVSPVMTRPYFYKGFDISGSLLPSSFSMNVTLSGPYGVDLQHLRVYMEEGSAIKEIHLPNRLPGPVTAISTSDFRCFFTEYDYNRFITAILRINNYYAAIDMMKGMETRMESERHTDTSSLGADYLNRLEWQRILNYIDDYGFIYELHLVEEDPGNFRWLREKLERLNTRHRTLFVQAALDKEKLHELATGKSIASYIALLNRYFDAKLDSDHQYALFYDRLIKSSLSAEQLEDEKRLLEQVSGGPELYEAFLNGLYGAFIKEGRKCMEEEDHEKSLTWLLKAFDLGTAQPGVITSDPELGKMMSTARKGLHDSYFYIVRKALEKGNVSMARSYMDEAVRISSSLWNQISFTTLFVLRRDIIASYLAACDTMVSSDPRATLRMIKELKGFCRQYNIECPEATFHYEQLAAISLIENKIKQAGKLLDNGRLSEADLLISDLHPVTDEQKEKVSELEYRMAEARFNRFLTGAGKFRELGDEELALRYYQLSYFLQRKYPDLDGERAAEGIRAMALPELTLKIGNVKDKIRQLDFDAARNGLDEIRKLQHEYFLVTDSTINAGVVDAELLLSAYRCDYETMRFRQTLDSAALLLAGHDFQAAILTLEHGLGSDDLSDCHIDTEEALGIGEKARHAIEYAAMQDRLHDLKYDPREFIREFSLMAAFYEEHALDEIGMEKRSMEDYMSRFNDTESFRLVADHFLGQDMHEEVIRILKMSKELGHDSKSYTEVLMELGSSLATTNYKNNAGMNPYIVINDLTKNDPWYDPFRESYLTTWRDLMEKNE